ncbi:DUF6519 domain-containing protein [Amycolatopsis sp. NBC_01480]|uniref:DUF6519 domain-containing protein n=1 Tax=Amycolatopsis sp. NBC_01480 TaxID=2903562 RepID=UPI002E29ED37|nr:DUF6519 domain-containing protein [Amycolatopsis sp. NBC_01480]
MVYLRVWERLITALQDPAIREVALGDPGPDTAARAKTVWQVAWCAGESTGDFQDFLQSVDPARGRLAARAKRPDDADEDVCRLPPEARFRGPENQLYRVEVHTGGLAWQDLSDVPNRSRRAEFVPALPGATFKWSRENASVVFPVVSVSGATVTLATLGRDGKLDLDVGDHVELVDDATASRVADDVPALQRPNPSPKLLTVVGIDPADRVVTLDSDVDDRCGPGTDPELHPLLRRWDHRASATYESGGRDVAADRALPLVEDTWIDLEDGVQVFFTAPPRPSASSAASSADSGGSYRRGDYWQIPARTITGDVEWPQDAGGPHAVVPHGVGYHYAVLGIIGADGQVTDRPISFEPLFPDPANRGVAGGESAAGGSAAAGGSSASGNSPAGSPAGGSATAGGSAAPGASPAGGSTGHAGPLTGGSAVPHGASAGPAAGGSAVPHGASAGSAASAVPGDGAMGASVPGGTAASGTLFTGPLAAGGSAGSEGASMGSSPGGSAMPVQTFAAAPAAMRSAAVTEGPPVPQMAFSRPISPLRQSNPQPSVSVQVLDNPPEPQPVVPTAGQDGPSTPRPATPSPVPRQNGSPAQPAGSDSVPGQEDLMPSRPTAPTAPVDAAPQTTPATAPTDGAPQSTPAAVPAGSAPQSELATDSTVPAAPAAPTTAPPVTGAPAGPLGNQLTSWLRTVVPGLWATLVAWLVSFGLPASMTGWLGGLGNQVMVPIVLAIVYALLRRLEPIMPPWLTRLLIGSNRPPSYASSQTA